MISKNDSFVREKRALEYQICHLVLFTTFKVANETQFSNSSNVIERTLENVPYIKSAQLIPIPQPTFVSPYFIQVPVIGQATLIQ